MSELTLSTSVDPYAFESVLKNTTLLLQIGQLHWLYDGFQINDTTEKAVLGEQFAYYNPLLGFSQEDYTVTFSDPNGKTTP